MSSIYVQVASYRDSELLPTLRDLRAKSSGKNKITIGICWQKDETETIEEFQNDPDVRIVSVPYWESKGLGWARSEIQKMYNDEDYTLQLDSHHRFSQNWDQSLISMYKMLLSQSSKPLLTAYAAAYDPKNDQNLVPSPSIVLPHDFKESGTIWFNPVGVGNFEVLKYPIRGRLVSGHYYFTTGQHCKEYVYDPDMYFAGDEICLSVRSYTLGYDIWHPNRCFVWHHYWRLDRSKHWSDHTDDAKKEGKIDTTWASRDYMSKRRIRQLLGEEDNGIDLGIYGLGNVRSIDDYQKYAGIDFKKKRISRAAIQGFEPPSNIDINNDEAFYKETPINIMEWPYLEYAKYIDQVTHLEIKFYNLQKQIIYSENIEKQKLLTMFGEPFSTVIKGNYYPMRLQFTLKNNDETVHVWPRDLRPSIQWN